MFYMAFHADNNTGILDWWQNKVMHRWIQLSINRSLTKMPFDHWNLMPNDTNAMEGSHADDNRKRGTNCSLLEAIMVYVDPNFIFMAFVPNTCVASLGRRNLMTKLRNSLNLHSYLVSCQIATTRFKNGTRIKLLGKLLYS